MKLYRRLPRLDLPNTTYFANITTADRRRWFGHPSCAEALCELICAERGQSVLLHAFVVMPDHYHLLVTLLGDHRLPSVVGKINSLAARRVNALMVQSGGMWSRRFYDHGIRGTEDFEECFKYIHDNPRARGLVAVAAEYPFSSASFFETGESRWGSFDPW